MKFSLFKILNKKGIAFELVITSTVIIFALCSLMSFYGIKSINMSVFESSNIEERLYLDGIGDDYLGYLNKIYKTFDPNSYYYDLNDLKMIYRVYTKRENEDCNEYIIVKDGNKVVLNIEFEYDEVNKKYDVIKWIYGE